MPGALPLDILSPASSRARVGFERIPQNLTRTELFRYFTFSVEDRHEILQCRGDHNRIGFALLLGGVRLTGRFPYDLASIPRHLLSHVCEQLGLETPLFVAYPQRQPTRYEHVERLKTYLGLRTFRREDHPLIAQFVRQQVRAGARLHELLPGTEQMLRTQGILLPGVTVLERLVGAARVAAEEELYGDLGRRIDCATKGRILALLQIPPGQRMAPFQQLQRASGCPSPEAFAQEVELLTQVRTLLPENLDLSDLPPSLLERLAGTVSGLPTQALLQFHEPKRLGLLLCWLWRLRTQLIDAALTISNELVAGVLRRAKHAAAKEQQRQHQQLRPVLTLCSEVVGMVLDQAIPDVELRTALFQRWPREQLQGLSAECRGLASPAERLYIAEVRRRYSYVRQFAPRLLETFVLRAVVPNEPLLRAVTYLRERNRNGQRGIDDDAPLDFVPPSWKPYVCSAPGQIDRPLWEICLLDQLRQALKGGNLNVPHSRAFQPLETYLLPREQWESAREQLCRAHQLPLDFAQHWPKVEALLNEQLRLLDQACPANPSLEIRDDQFHLMRAERFPLPPSAYELRLMVRRMLQRRQLSDLLLETQGWTGFLKAFTRLTSGRPITEADIAEQITLLACLIAEGNIGLSDMAVASAGLSFDQLEEVYATHLEPREHYTDTHGYTELIFAVCHLLGIRFAPRLKDLAEQRLWRLPGAEVYPHIVAIQSLLKAGLLNAVQVELWFMIGGLHPVTKAVRSPSFRNFARKHALTR